jgi:hypothetical protein
MIRLKLAALPVASPPVPIYYRSAHWRALRHEALVRDRFSCTVPGCGKRYRTVDHVVTRRPVAYPTSADVINNLRTLCSFHDTQVKERKRGDSASRQNDGTFTVKGCDENGLPFDPRFRR